MRFNRKEPTKPLSERTADVAAALRQLRFMPKFPEDTEQLAFIAKLVAKFCETVDVNVAKPDEAKPDVMPVPEWFNPLNWMVEQIGSSYTFFPTVIQMRRIYDMEDNPVSALDGKTATEIQNSVEE